MPDQTAPAGSFAAYLTADERDQLDARAATAESERDDALTDLRAARADRDRYATLLWATAEALHLPVGTPGWQDAIPAAAAEKHDAARNLADQLDLARVGGAHLQAELDEMREARDVLRHRLDQLTAENARLRRDLAAHNTHTPLPVSWHVTRSTGPTDLETRCPCPKAPCGGVDTRQTNPACDQHPSNRTKTMRQIHRADQCPAVAPVPAARAQEHDEQAEG